MVFAAGQKVRAADLNDITPLYARCGETTSVTSSTTLVAITGMSIAVDADSEYALDGYIGYAAGSTGDIKFAITVPSGATGHWAVAGVVSSATGDGGTEGALNGLRLAAFGTSNTIALAGSANNSGRMLGLPRGYLATGSSVGSVAVMFAQNTSNGTASTVQSGSWLRLWKIA